MPIPNVNLDITVRELRDAQKLAEGVINAALTEFHRKTGAMITDIQFSYDDITTLSSQYREYVVSEVRTEVKL